MRIKITELNPVTGHSQRVLSSVAEVENAVRQLSFMGMVMIGLPGGRVAHDTDQALQMILEACERDCGVPSDGAEEVELEVVHMPLVVGG